MAVEYEVDAFGRCPVETADVECGGVVVITHGEEGGVDAGDFLYDVEGGVVAHGVGEGGEVGGVAVFDDDGALLGAEASFYLAPFAVIDEFEEVGQVLICRDGGCYG